jgi:DNA-binding IscR family transcriptional regulator
MKYTRMSLVSKTARPENEMPEKFLEAILMDLKRVHFVVSVRGANVGYQLQRPPQNFSLVFRRPLLHDFVHAGSSRK